MSFLDLSTSFAILTFAVSCAILAIALYTWRRAEFNRRFGLIEKSLIDLSESLNSISLALDAFISDSAKDSFDRAIREFSRKYQAFQSQRLDVVFSKINKSLSREVKEIYNTYWDYRVKVWEETKGNETTIRDLFANYVREHSEYQKLIRQTKKELDKFVEKEE